MKTGKTYTIEEASRMIDAHIMKEAEILRKNLIAKCLKSNNP